MELIRDQDASGNVFFPCLDPCPAIACNVYLFQIVRVIMLFDVVSDFLPQPLIAFRSLVESAMIMRVDQGAPAFTHLLLAFKEIDQLPENAALPVILLAVDVILVGFYVQDSFAFLLFRRGFRKILRDLVHLFHHRCLGNRLPLIGDRFRRVPVGVFLRLGEHLSLRQRTEPFVHGQTKNLFRETSVLSSLPVPEHRLLERHVPYRGDDGSLYLPLDVKAILSFGTVAYQTVEIGKRDPHASGHCTVTRIRHGSFKARQLFRMLKKNILRR